MNIPPKIDRERVACAGRQADGEIWRIDRKCRISDDDTGGVVFSVCAHLNRNRSILKWVGVDERHGDDGRTYALNERGHVLRKTGTAPIRIEMAHLSMKGKWSVPRSIGVVSAHREVDQRGGRHRILTRPARRVVRRPPAGAMFSGGVRR